MGQVRLLAAGIITAALVSTPAGARTLRPKQAPSKGPPMPVLAIAEEIRTSSGDASYGIVVEEEEPPPPAPTPEERPVVDVRPPPEDPPRPTPQPVDPRPTPRPVDPGPLPPPNDRPVVDLRPTPDPKDRPVVDIRPAPEPQDDRPRVDLRPTPQDDRPRVDLRPAPAPTPRPAPVIDRRPLDDGRSDRLRDLERDSQDLRRRLIEDHQNSAARLREDHQDKRRQWQQEFDETKRRWEREHQEFLRRVPEYKQSLAPIRVGSASRAPVNKAPKDTPTRPLANSTYFLIDGALEIPVRDQSSRATCAAFAAVRSVEILLAQNDRRTDLSEQYFYWLSKPKCRERPCDEVGSWSAMGLRESARMSRIDIPSEQACPYNPKPVAGNETQVPLPRACLARGETRVRGFAEVRDEAAIFAALHQQMPVIVGTKLSENYFTTRGIVDLAGSRSSAKTRDSMHVEGHAYLLVGYMQLPRSMHAREGNYCFIAANSWSEGWGQGGYACLTQKWFQEHKLDIPFLTVTEVDVP